MSGEIWVLTKSLVVYTGSASNEANNRGTNVCEDIWRIQTAVGEHVANKTFTVTMQVPPWTKLWQPCQTTSLKLRNTCWCFLCGLLQEDVQNRHVIEIDEWWKDEMICCTKNSECLKKSMSTISNRNFHFSQQLFVFVIMFEFSHFLLLSFYWVEF